MKIEKFKKLYIEITNECNLSCPFCLTLNRKKAFMSISDFGNIINKIKSYTKYIYLHVKGEPLIHPNFQAILDIAYRNGMFVNVTTNGTLIESQYEVLLNSHIRQLNISIHSLMYFKEEIQKKYLDWIIKLINEITVKGNYYISLRFWLGENQKQNYSISYLEEKLGVKLKDDKKPVLPHIFVSYANEFVWPEEAKSDIGFNRCHGIKDHLGILVDGSVVPCCLDGNGKVVLGNILTQSMEEILESERYLKMLEAFRTKKMLEELCLHCSYKDRFS